MKLSERALSLDELLAATEDPACGALVVFAGTVRNHHEGKAVTGLDYTAYAPIAEPLIAQVERDAIQRFGVAHCRVVHRVGKLGIGEVAIYAVVRAAHRKEAFACAQWAVDEVKHRAPIWKEEFYPDGSSAFVTGCCIAPDAGAAAATPELADGHRPHHAHGHSHVHK